MIVDEAHTILGIDIPEDKITYEYLKRQYKRHALIYHPDKNKSSDASLQFQRVVEAFEFLEKYYGYISDDDNNPFIDLDSHTPYKDLLCSFLSNIIDKELFTNIQNHIFFKIIERITDHCEIKATQLLEKIDKDILFKIYNILKKNKDVLHISESFLTDIENTLYKKTQNDYRIVLYPNLNDLFLDNVYKLVENGNTYFIPLWVNEMVYDDTSGNGEIIVNCMPTLPDFISIDSWNHLHFYVKYYIKDIFDKQTIYLNICEKKTLIIHTQKLKLMKNQTLTFYEEGVSMLNTKNVYDNSKKSNIYVYIELII